MKRFRVSLYAVLFFASVVLWLGLLAASPPAALAYSTCDSTDEITLGTQSVTRSANNDNRVRCFYISGYQTDRRVLGIQFRPSRGEYDLYVIPGHSTVRLSDAFRSGPISSEQIYAYSNPYRSYTIAVAPRGSGSFSVTWRVYQNHAPVTAIPSSDSDGEEVRRIMNVPTEDAPILGPGASLVFPFYMACPGRVNVRASWEGTDMIMLWMEAPDSPLIIPIPVFSPVELPFDFTSGTLASSHQWQFRLQTIGSTTVRVTEVELSYPNPWQCWDTTGLSYSMSPNFGEISLSGGAFSDPYSTAAVSGGSVDAGAFQDIVLPEGCYGFVTRAPDYRLVWSGNGPFYIRFQGDGDTTLMVNDPGNRWYCNDDAFELQPMVHFSNPSNGQYDIWIGSYNAEDRVSGRLYISQQAELPSSPSPGSLDCSAEARYGEVSLSAGFLPDPYSVGMSAGGNVAVSDQGLSPVGGGTCAGYVMSNPDYRLFWSETSNLLRIYFNGDGDNTLIINDANGNWRCDDDSGGDYQPSIAISNPPQGRYDIWVGSFEGASTYHSGTLYISELQ